MMITRSPGWTRWAAAPLMPITPLPLEALGGAAQPIVHRPVRTTLQSQLDQSWIATVQAAQQVDGVCQIAPRMTARSFEQRSQVGMTGAAFTRNSRELGFGDADRTGPLQSMTLMGSFMADGPICCHSLPLVLASPRKPCRIVVAEGRKDEVYDAVSFREPYL